MLYMIVWMPCFLYVYLGVHYATGHVFDMKSITEAGHKKVNMSSYSLTVPLSPRAATLGLT